VSNRNFEGTAGGNRFEDSKSTPTM